MLRRGPPRLLGLVAVGATLIAAGALLQGDDRVSEQAGGAQGFRGPLQLEHDELIGFVKQGFRGRTDFARRNVALAEFVPAGPPRNGIPSIDDPKFLSVRRADQFLDDTEPVAVVVLRHEIHAYPLQIMVWHEIVNDTLGGVPVVVTFCPLCHTALVFDRRVADVVHDFGTTGNLRFSDLVMYDRQTESWWQQATGQAIVGSLTDTKLTFLPAQIVSLADFATAYPNGEVLSRDTGENRPYGQNPYPGYDRADERPFLFAGEIDGRLAPKERVVTIDQDGSTIAIPYTALDAMGAIEIDLPEPVVVFWAPGTAAALDGSTIDAGRDVGATGVFAPVVDGQRLTFARTGGREGPITDVETGSTWSITGQATDGPLAGSQLEPVVHGDHFWFAWAAFSPETTIWSAP